MYTVEYSGDNIYTGDISDTSDIKYVNVFNFDYNFSTDKSIILDPINSTANVCFYKNKGDAIFSIGKYSGDVTTFSDKTFYQDNKADHILTTVPGYSSSSYFLGSSNISLEFGGDCGVNISYIDVYNVVFSFWIYTVANILYIKDNTDILYNCRLSNNTVTFSLYKGSLIINSESVDIFDGNFLPYSLFVYGDFTDISIFSKYCVPTVFEGSGEVIDDIYGDVYCLSKPQTGISYLRSKATNILTSCSGFIFDIACRAVGNSIPFSISAGGSFDGSSFIMDNASVWVEFDAINDIFYSNIVTSSGVTTISGVLSELNDYYLLRCYYKDGNFGTILNGNDVYTPCPGVTISGNTLNILTYNTLVIDSFALYEDILPTQEGYNESLNKLTTAVSSVSLVDSHGYALMFGVDNFYPENTYYTGAYSDVGDIPILSSSFTYYTGYSLAGGEADLNLDNFYVSRLSFDEGVYNCFLCENDKTFLTYFSSIIVPVNQVVAESFTNYNYVDDDFITTNSGLHIRNTSKVFNSMDSASIVEFSDIGWVNSFDIGILFGTNSIPVYPNERCSALTGSGNLYIGTTVISGVSNNSSVYFYLEGPIVTVSGSDTGILGSASVVSSYDYIHYFIRNTASDFATINKIYVSTTQREIDTLNNKFFSYTLPEYYNLDNSYTELFYNIGSSISGDGIILYDLDFRKHQCSFSSYYDTTFSGMFNISGYTFLGISDDFKNGFITERWRLICTPYGVYSCNQPGMINIDSAHCSSCYSSASLYDGNTSVSVHSSGDIINPGDYYYLYFTKDACLVDTVSIYVTSDVIGPGDGFVISCDVEYRSNDAWYSLLTSYVSSTLSGTSWPIRHDISVPLGRCAGIRIVADSDWDLVTPTEIRPACYYNYGGTSVCTVNDVTCVHTVLDDELHIYSEYTLEDSFNLSFSGINYYPCNSKIILQDYSGDSCYIKTDWTSSGICNLVVSSGTGSINTTVSGLFGDITYAFYVVRSLDIINLDVVAAGESVSSNYAFSSDDLGLDLVFYNKSIPHVAGSGCLFGFDGNNYTVNFSSIAAGYKFNALDGTDNITNAGVGFNTYPPNLFVEKTRGSSIEQSHMPCVELTASGFQLTTSIVDNNIFIKTGIKNVGGVQQVSKFNRVDLFSDYIFMPTVLYRSYIVGQEQQYTSFSSISSFVQSGDKVYFYPGNYIITTDKQITIIGIGNPTEIQLKIDNASLGLTVMGCTTTKCNGSGIFNMYNCYILPWDYGSDHIILYNVININFYNCSLYNYERMSYTPSYVLLHACSVYKTSFTYYQGSGSIIIYNEGYDTRGHYGYGPEFNRVSIISGLSHIDNIIVSSFYHNSVYNHFPLHTQLPVEKDSCNQLISSTDSYSVYFYGDIKKLNSFSMYLFIQDLDGKIEIKNSSDFELIVDSDNLDAGIHLVMNIYGLEINMPIPISHSYVFKLSMVVVVFDGGSVSIYLNGAKLAIKYIIVTDFNDPSAHLDDSILFFDDTKFTCDGNGLLLKGAALKRRVDFLVGTHVEELESGGSTTIKVNMEFSTAPTLSEYHNITGNYYGYTAYNTGVGLYDDPSVLDYKHIYFNASKSYKVYQNVAKKYLGIYRRMEQGNCISESETVYVSSIEKDSITFGAAKIDMLTLGHCDILDPYGYVSLDLSLPLPVVSRESYCFDVVSSVVMVSFDLASSPHIRDVGPNSLTCNYQSTYGGAYKHSGIFHNSLACQKGDYAYINHNNVLNLNNNFTIECLCSFQTEAGYNGYLLTKGTNSYNIAYRVGVTSSHIPYFKWSWEGDNTVYAEKPIQTNDVTYLVVVIGVDTVSFYINGRSAGTIYTDKLTIINNSESLRIMYGFPITYVSKKQTCVEEICLLNKVKTKEEIEYTWDTIGGGEDAPWIKISNVVVVSDRPIKVSPSDRFIEEDKKIDISKWEYTSYKKPVAEDGLIVDSRLTKKIISKVVSYNVIFDVSIFCEFLEYSTDRDWSVTFKYKFASNNYISVVINYVKYDGLYVKCEYYYNGYKNSTNITKLTFVPCGIRFITDYNRYTHVQIGNYIFWYTLWTSTQNLFVETSGWLEVTTSNDDWDSWFIVKLTNFLPRLFCSSIINGQTSEFYTAVPYGRSFYNQIPDNIASLTLSNDIFEIDSTSAGSDCIHSLEFVNGQLSSNYVVDLTDYIFDNINCLIFNVELLVYLTYDNTNILDLFPWINIDVKDKYIYITMYDNDRAITDSISVELNNYVYIAVSLSTPHTTIYINNKKFIYDTNFVNPLPYHFYPIGKSFKGRVVYFCGYRGTFDLSGYTFRVATLDRYIGFDCCGRKIYGGNMVTSLDTDSVIYTYNSPTYSTLLKTTGCSLGYDNSLDVKVLFDIEALSSIIAASIIIKCEYLSQPNKTMDIYVSIQEYNVNHNYYDSFGYVGESSLLVDYNLVGTSINDTSIFYLDITKEILEKVLKGTAVLTVKNKETQTISNVLVYLDGQLSINDFYNSSLLV